MVNPAAALIKVAEVKDDVFVLITGGLRAILAVPGINFSLLANQEKELVIAQFKEFLDGLDFPLQILVLSRLANIENYLASLNQRLQLETDALIKVQLEEYINFIKEYVETHKIMKKIFYVVVPYDSIALEVKIGSFFKKSKYKKEEAYYQQVEQLETRVIYVSEKLSALGLQSIRLNTAELVQLLFEMYNPNTRWGMAPVQLFEELIEKIRA